VAGFFNGSMFNQICIKFRRHYVPSLESVQASILMLVWLL